MSLLATTARPFQTAAEVPPSHHLLARSPPSFDDGDRSKTDYMVCRLAFVIVSVATVAAVIYLGRNGTEDMGYMFNDFLQSK